MRDNEKTFNFGATNTPNSHEPERARLRNKAIGLLFNTTPNSVIKAKQRLKHKLGLLPEESLYEFVRRL